MADGEFAILTGATGFLGHYLQRELEVRRIPFAVAGRQPEEGYEGKFVELDLARPDTVSSVFDGAIVIHAGAMSSMGACTRDPDTAMDVNARSAGEIAKRADRMLFVSTDLVFDGEDAPYLPEAPAEPLNAYGRSKLAGERLVLEAGSSDGGHNRHLVVRLPLLFGRSFDGRRGATDMLRASAAMQSPLTLFDNEYRTPLHVELAARTLIDLVPERGAPEILHIAGDERVSRTDLAERFLSVADDVEPGPWTPGPCEDPERPRDVSLRTDLPVQPDLDAMLEIS